MKAAQLEVVRIVLRSGKSLPEHQVPGEITAQCMEGSGEFSEPSGRHVLEAGDFLHLAVKVLHALRAITDTSLL